MPSKTQYTRILSIDGGGIRGVIPGVVLTVLEEKLIALTGAPDTRLADFFDLMAGTSTGGILTACCLLPGPDGRPKFKAAEIVELYFKHGEEIFKRSIFHKVKTVGGLLDERYPDKGLRKVLKKYMGDVRLADLLKTGLFTAYDIERRKAHFFSSRSAVDKGHDFFLRDVAWSTSAAPTYFEVARIKDGLNRDYALIDKGVFAGNPTLCAYAEARKIFRKPDSDRAVTAEDMIVLSLGTGTAKENYPYHLARDWGMAQWVRPLIDIMMSGVAETVDYQVRQIYDAVGRKSQYLRVNAPLPSDVNHQMDDAGKENMEALRRQGEAVAEKFDAELQDLAERLVSVDCCDMLA